ncbi:N-6 DNA methylase, partial [Arthrospira platensis SPKY1]|nr:N-6 DNA methylase [Arthrospira platensis SPKY1]
SDVYDEEYRQALEESDGDEEYAQLPEFHKFIVPEGCHWNDVRETTVNVGLAIEKALRGIEQVKAKGGDYRTLKLYGQEKNLTSSAIARMNMFLHGVEDFRVERGDTLRQPAFFAADGLQTFDCVIANPPFSLKEWGATAWTNDPYGRNIAGVPPQGNGDMAWV